MYTFLYTVCTSWHRYSYNDNYYTPQVLAIDLPLQWDHCQSEDIEVTTHCLLLKCHMQLFRLKASSD